MPRKPVLPAPTSLDVNSSSPTDAPDRNDRGSSVTDLLTEGLIPAAEAGTEFFGGGGGGEDSSSVVTESATENVSSMLPTPTYAYTPTQGTNFIAPYPTLTPSPTAQAGGLDEGTEGIIEAVLAMFGAPLATFLFILVPIMLLMCFGCGRKRQKEKQKKVNEIGNAALEPDVEMGNETQQQEERDRERAETLAKVNSISTQDRQRNWINEYIFDARRQRTQSMQLGNQQTLRELKSWWRDQELMQVLKSDLQRERSALQRQYHGLQQYRTSLQLERHELQHPPTSSLTQSLKVPDMSLMPSERHPGGIEQQLQRRNNFNGLSAATQGSKVRNGKHSVARPSIVAVRRESASRSEAPSIRTPPPRYIEDD